MVLHLYMLKNDDELVVDIFMLDENDFEIECMATYIESAMYYTDEMIDILVMMQGSFSLVLRTRRNIDFVLMFLRHFLKVSLLEAIYEGNEIEAFEIR